MTSRVEAIDVDGHSVMVNPSGKYTLVLSTNPDLEDETREIVKSLDQFRTKSNFNFVRVVDLSGGVPLEVRTIVRMQIRKAQDGENTRLKPLFKAIGVTNLSRSMSPIIPDFTGATLHSLHLQDGSSHIQAIIFDESGHELKRFDQVDDSSTLPGALGSVL